MVAVSYFLRVAYFSQEPSARGTVVSRAVFEQHACLSLTRSRPAQLGRKPARCDHAGFPLRPPDGPRFLPSKRVRESSPAAPGSGGQQAKPAPWFRLSSAAPRERMPLLRATRRREVSLLDRVRYAGGRQATFQRRHRYRPDTSTLVGIFQL